MKLYDANNKRLLVYAQEATEHFWDAHWDKENGNGQGLQLSQPVFDSGLVRLVRNTTKEFLPVSSKILEGGCGMGQHVRALHGAGYHAEGIDFAPETISLLKKHFPELAFSVQDVRNLAYADGSFDGYWSLGVIEHFFEGYGAIIKEMERVIRPGGYVFITVPYMSPFRKLKALSGFYPLATAENDASGFYQFMLNSDQVEQDFASAGMVLVKKQPFDGLKGLKDEASFAKKILQRFYDSKNIWIRRMRFVISKLLAPITGHVVLMVFKKI